MQKKGVVDMAETAVQELLEQEEDTQKGRFLTFSLSNESYGIEIQYVTEIIGIQPVTEIPELPEYIKGIINLRGKITPRDGCKADGLKNHIGSIMTGHVLSLLKSRMCQ